MGEVVQAQVLKVVERNSIVKQVNQEADFYLVVLDLNCWNFVLLLLILTELEIIAGHVQDAVEEIELTKLENLRRHMNLPAIKIQTALDIVWAAHLAELALETKPSVEALGLVNQTLADVAALHEFVHLSITNPKVWLAANLQILFLVEAFD